MSTLLSALIGSSGASSGEDNREFKNHQGHGLVIIVSPNEEIKYVGEYRDELPNGYGILDYDYGGIFVGEFKHGDMHGRGTVVSADGERHVGTFEKNLYRGYGTHTHPTGEKFVGEFKDDSRHGHGVFTRANGERYAGQWKDDRGREGRGDDRGRRR